MDDRTGRILWKTKKRSQTELVGELKLVVASGCGILSESSDPTVEDSPENACGIENLVNPLIQPWKMVLKMPAGS